MTSLNIDILELNCRKKTRKVLDAVTVYKIHFRSIEIFGFDEKPRRTVSLLNERESRAK